MSVKIESLLVVFANKESFVMALVGYIHTSHKSDILGEKKLIYGNSQYHNSFFEYHNEFIQGRNSIMRAPYTPSSGQILSGEKKLFMLYYKEIFCSIVNIAIEHKFQ